MFCSSEMFRYMFKAEFVTLASLRVPSGYLDPPTHPGQHVGAVPVSVPEVLGGALPQLPAVGDVGAGEAPDAVAAGKGAAAGGLAVPADHRAPDGTFKLTSVANLREKKM